MTKSLAFRRQAVHSTATAGKEGCSALSLPSGALGQILAYSSLECVKQEVYDTWQKDLRTLMKTRVVWQRLKDIKDLVGALLIECSSLDSLFGVPMSASRLDITPHASARIFGGIGRASQAFLRLKSQVESVLTAHFASLEVHVAPIAASLKASLPPLKGYAANLVVAQMELHSLSPAGVAFVRGLEQEAGITLRDSLCPPVTLLQRLCGIITTISREAPNLWDASLISSAEEGSKMAADALDDVGGFLQSLSEMRRLGVTPDIVPYHTHRRVMLVCPNLVLPGLVSSAARPMAAVARGEAVFMNDVIVVCVEKARREHTVFYTANTQVVRVRGISGHDNVISIRSNDTAHQIILSMTSEEDLRRAMNCYMLCVRQCQELGMTPYSWSSEATC